MKIYYIYKITNTVNNKIYIGFTGNYFRRISEHRKLPANTKLRGLKAAIRKYGWDKFTTEIIFESTDKDYCKNIMEPFYIELYNSYEQGYNQTKGGDGGAGRVVTDEERRAASARYKGQKSINKGKTYKELYGEEKAKQKISKFKNTMREKWKNKNPKKQRRFPHKEERLGLTFDEIYGNERSKEIRAKQSAASIGENNHRYGKPGTMLGKKHTEESLAKMRVKTGPHKKAREKLTCPHCGNVSDSSNSKRWHFDKCKHKKIID